MKIVYRFVNEICFGMSSYNNINNLEIFILKIFSFLAENKNTKRLIKLGYLAAKS